MKYFLNKKLAGTPLSKTEALEALTKIGKGEVNASLISAFLTTYMVYPVTPDELEGFRDAMMDLAITVDLSAYDPMDVCGTGGDGKDTFNVSTTASFVVAGTGQAVAKHGNHGVSSSVGSSTVLEYFGVRFSNDESYLRKKIEQAGICFLHAPLFHPAMRFVGPIRKELGMKTFFNMLGPILNPANVNKQITGVYDEEVFKLYSAIFQKSKKQFGVLYGLDGYDEISLTSSFILNTSRAIETISPKQMGLSAHKPEDLYGGHSLEASARIMTSILENKATKAQKEVVIANAATALYAIDDKLSITDAVAKAQESLESGRALNAFIKFIAN